MDPKKPETLEERMQAIEIEFKFFKEEIVDGNASMCQDIEDVRAEGKETRLMVIGINTEMATMPGKISKAIMDELRTKKLDVNVWVGLVCTVLVTIAAIWGMVK